MASHNEELTVDKLKGFLQEIKPPAQIFPDRMLMLAARFYANTITDEEREEIRKLREQIGANADEVYPGIFIGNEKVAQNLQFLKDLGMGFVLNVAQGNSFESVNTDEDFYTQHELKFFGLNMDGNITLNDKYFTDQSGTINKAIQFIDEAVNNSGKILVHCQGGMSRSPFIVGMYLMIEKKFTAVEALRLMRQKRDIFPNDGFLKQIINLENKLRI